MAVPLSTLLVVAGRLVRLAVPGFAAAHGGLMSTFDDVVVDADRPGREGGVVLQLTAVATPMP